jgi:hypothetical protein
VKDTIDSKLRNLSKILKRFPVDVLSVGFSFVDHSRHLGVSEHKSHDFAEYSIRETMKIADPEKFLIVSDHGIDHTKNATLITSKRIRRRDYKEWDVCGIILRMLK